MIPIQTDYRMRTRPWVNYALVAANVLIFLAGLNNMSLASSLRITPFMLQPEFPLLHQFLSCMFLHAGWQHLLGNMLFLWVFGNVLNDRLGHLGYLLFYLAGGIVAGLGYVLLTPDAPVLGASGAISAVTGAFLVLFPRVHVTLLVWFWLVFTYQIPSLILLGLYVIRDLWMSWHSIVGSNLGGVAYVAHSSGYLFGIVMVSIMLLLRLLPRDGYDLLYLFRQDFRRRRYRRAVQTGPGPFGPNRMLHTAEPGARHVDAKTVNKVGRRDTQAGQELELRRQIAGAVGHGSIDDAIDSYTRLIEINDDVVLPRQQQLDIANQLMTMARYPAAAEAYERFLRNFRSYEHVGDIELMLGMIYGRYLGHLDRAVELLTHAEANLHDDRKKTMAAAELAIVQRKTGPS